MTITLATRKRLWVNSGGLCAFNGCKQRLLLPFEDATDVVTVGRECHIVAQAAAGPRGPDTLDPDEATRFAHLVADRDGYANLILLCGMHHDVIDSDVAGNPVASLVTRKNEHESEVISRLTPTERHDEAIELRYASIVDEWAKRIEIDYWDGRISSLAVSATIREDVIRNFESVRYWLLNRVWPRKYPALEAAFVTFRAVSEDLDAVATRYSTTRGDTLLVDRVYNEVWGERATGENLEFLERRSDYYHDLAADLAIELTRAVNLICDRVREHLWPNYRLEEGYATIGLGLDQNLSFGTLRPLYAVDTPDQPYPGLQAFVKERSGRDYARGEGEPPKARAFRAVGHKCSRATSTPAA